MSFLPLSRAPRVRRRRSLLAVAAVAAVGIASLTLGLSAPAHAASTMISGAITDVTVAPTTPHQGSQITTNIDWKVPDGTQAGDTFTLTLSSDLTDLPSGFALRDPATGAIVANAVLSPPTPSSIITFTMTAYASTHLQTHGTAFVVSSFSASKVPSGTPTPIVSTTNDGKTFSTSITPTGIVGDRSIPIKYGKFSADEGRLDPTDFITYHVDTPMGPSTSTTIADSVPAGQNWTFDCTSVGYVDQTIAADNSISAQSPVTPLSADCTDSSITATLPAVAASHIIVLTYSISLPAATGVDSAPQTFFNRAVVTTTADGTTTSGNADASNVQSSGGGDGAGVNAVSAVSITKGDSNGNAADTDGTAATLPVSGKASLVYKVTNTGADALTNVAVTDQVLANGTVTGLSCDFSAFGGPSTGTTFTGSLPAGASFPCTSALSGVSSTGPDHHDVGTVTATGVVSGTAVTASNDYFAKVTPGAAGTPPTGGNSGTPVTGGGTGPGTPTGGNTGPGTTTTTPVTSPVAPAAAGTTPLADNGTGSLAYTGSNVEAPLGLAGGLLALGALLSVLGVLRRRRAAEQS